MIKWIEREEDLWQLYSLGEIDPDIERSMGASMEDYPWLFYPKSFLIGVVFGGGDKYDGYRACFEKWEPKGTHFDRSAQPVRTLATLEDAQQWIEDLYYDDDMRVKLLTKNFVESEEAF